MKGAERWPHLSAIFSEDARARHLGDEAAQLSPSALLRASERAMTEGRVVYAVQLLRLVASDLTNMLRECEASLPPDVERDRKPGADK